MGNALVECSGAAYEFPLDVATIGLDVSRLTSALFLRLRSVL
jgi:hypothetical protein